MRELITALLRGRVGARLASKSRRAERSWVIPNERGGTQNWAPSGPTLRAARNFAPRGVVGLARRLSYCAAPSALRVAKFRSNAIHEGVL